MGKTRSRKSQANVDCGLRFSRTRKAAMLKAYMLTTVVKTTVHAMSPTICPISTI
jgi:hypothetical protein